MDLEKELERLAARYTAEGYQVVVHPDADHLPPFAKDFGVNLVATRGDERVLVQAKWDRSALEADRKAVELADIASKQPGWRYDVVILNESDPLRRMMRGSREPTEDEIGQLADRAEAVAAVDHAGAACVLGWAALEAAMRHQCREVDLFMPRYSPTELLRTLYGNGILSREDFDQLAQSYRLRSELVHGFVPSAIDPKLIHAPIRAARRLLAPNCDTHAVAR